MLGFLSFVSLTPSLFVALLLRPALSASESSSYYCCVYLVADLPVEHPLLRTYTVRSGIYAGFHVLSISFQAQRLATMSSIFLIFPLCLVCLALVLVLSQEPAKDARLAVPATGITATMYFSFVVSNMCPPVSYVTRLHLLIFQTYIFAAAELCFNYYLWRVQVLANMCSCQ